MPNHSHSLENDTIIDGTYRVLDFLGEGGMGVVYKVEHTQLNKILALKIIKTSQLSDSVWQRFRNEAQAIARLDHRNVVKIYDMNQTENGRPYYTMDFLTGVSLADYLKEHKILPLPQALNIFRQVCSGLAYAHSRGIIHRDIKPANIMLLTDRRINSYK
jgi:serine/threonine protein kinase